MPNAEPVQPVAEQERAALRDRYRREGRKQQAGQCYRGPGRASSFTAELVKDYHQVSAHNQNSAEMDVKHRAAQQARQ